MTPRSGNHTQPDTAVIGMGRTGCSVVRFLEHRGMACAAFDEHLRKLPEGIHARLHTGRLKAKALQEFKRIIVSPGVPWRHPVLTELREQGIRLSGDLDLFNEYFSGDLLAVTGTNGKSTVVHLLGLMLEVLPGGAEMGGNIGIPMLETLLGREQPARVVLELSSFQLERCHGIRPGWAVLLNVQPDHADMHASQEAYAAAKQKLFDEQGEGDTAVLPVDEHWDTLAHRLTQRGVRVRRFGVVDDDSRADAGLLIHGEQHSLFWTNKNKRRHVRLDHVMVRGAHQHLNLAVAAQAAADFDVSTGVIAEAVTAFRGLDHRLRYIGHHSGKPWYDDSKATNPDAAAAALVSFEHVIWICGGLTKGLDLTPLTDAVRRHVAFACVIGKQPKPYLKLLEQAGVPFKIAGDIRHAVMLAAQADIPLPVLLSPAAASQDQFRDYAERGRRFAEALASLEKAA